MDYDLIHQEVRCHQSLGPSDATMHLMKESSNFHQELWSIIVASASFPASFSEFLSCEVKHRPKKTVSMLFLGELTGSSSFFWWFSLGQFLLAGSSAIT